MKKKKLLLLFIIICLPLLVLCIINISNKKENIDKILTSEDYAYLSSNTKEFIKKVYVDTGELILTERNKKDNVPYLNPEYDKYLSLSEKDKENIDLIPSTTVVDYASSEGDTNNYENYYNISNNYITPMNNQGKLGICWAISTIEQAESFLMVKNNQPYSSSSERFSLRQLDYAASINGINNYENENGYRFLTEGGNFYMSSTIMSYGLSLTNYTEFDQNVDKKDLHEVLNFENSKYELDSTIMMPRLSSSSSAVVKNSYVEDVKNNIKKYGGAYVGTGSPADNCGFKNTDGSYVIVDADDCVGSSGHALQIVGWDDDYTYSYCQSQNFHDSVNESNTCTNGNLKTGKGAWILRNSWGDESPYKFVYMGYDSYGYEINFITSLSSMKDRAWNNLYHKNFWENGFVSKNLDSVRFNKYIDGAEKLEKIKFMTNSSNGEYVVTLESDNEIIELSNFKTRYPGLYTIDVSDKNIIINDNNFKVSIRGKNDAYLIANSISAFTSNMDSKPIVKTNNLDLNSLMYDELGNYMFIIYSATKNIKSNEKVEYKLYKNNIDYSDYIVSLDKTIVAENNVNAKIVLSKNLPSGEYDLVANYNRDTFFSKIIIPEKSNLKGNGTQDDPYLIYNEDDLQQIRYNLDAYYLLKNDIHLEKNWIPIGTSKKPFRGGFDGDNHTIYGLKINENSDSEVGFFGYVDVKYWYESQVPVIDFIYKEETYIRNLYIDGANVSNKSHAGILIGHLNYNTNNLPDNARNIRNHGIHIDNIYITHGNVTSMEGDAGSLIGNINILPRARLQPFLVLNNIYSSADVFGKHSSGMIGYLNDLYESGSAIRIHITATNIQNVGRIDVKSHNIDYQKTNNYSAFLGGIYGNALIDISNYIINTIYTDANYMGEYLENDSSILIGYYNQEHSSAFNINSKNGYYINGLNKSSRIESITANEAKNSDLYKTWTDFDKYWKIETIEGIKRIPVLKNIEYDYTSINDITINRYEEKSLLDYLGNKNDFWYVQFDIISNDDIVLVNKKASTDYYYDDIIIEGLNKGEAIIHIINNYDGNERDVKVNVVAEKVDSPVITYYYNYSNNTSEYSQRVVANKSFNLSKNQFNRDGYSLESWNTMKSGDGLSYKDEELIEGGIDENLKLYAQWKLCKYSLHFDSNGGIGTMEDLTNMSSISYYSLPTNLFQKNKYLFKEWNTKADGSGISYKNKQMVDLRNLVHSDGEIVTLYAIWTPISYTVSFYANGGTGIIDSMTVSADSTVILPDNGFTKVGYTFKEWNTKADGSGISYKKNQEISLSDNIKLYAIWDKNTYKVTYYSNNEKNETESKSMFYNDSISIEDNMFEYDGYDFVEWNTKADGSGKSYKLANLLTVNGDINLYAIWKESFDYTINNYLVDKINNYISKVMVNTTTEEYIKNIVLNSEFSINIETKNQVLFTGAKTVINKNNDKYAEYTNVVIGDINGDGEINSADLLKIRQHLLGVNILTEIYFLASDINYDYEINSADLFRVRQHLLGIKPIE